VFERSQPTNFNHPSLSEENACESDRTMTTRSIYRELNDRTAILNVPLDHVKTLGPHDPRPAIGMQILDGSSCLVMMSTTPKAAITMAHVARVEPSRCTCGNRLQSARRKGTITASDVHYTDLLRKVVYASLKGPELYQMPLAWAVFGLCKDTCEGDVEIKNVRERTERVFQHMGVNLGGSLYEMFPPPATPPYLTGRTVVVVRYESEVPEIYVGNRLMYPKDHSGTLALAFDKLALRQVGYEPGDDDGHDGVVDVGFVTHGEMHKST
jgi:hypothetical protein